jgi:D-glycero-alpha-D-manno-heptose 1-phosphate guanylyltransferase
METPERRAVVLAGGKGERLRKVVSDVPKPLAPVAGKPFLHWVLSYLAKQGVNRVVVSTGYMAEAIERSVAGWSIAGQEVVCRAESSPLGTAGGVKNAVAGQPLGAWLVVNADTLALTGLDPLYAVFQRNAGAVLGVHQEDASRYGRLELDTEGCLSAFKEKQPGAGLINAGSILLSQALIDQIPKGRAVSLEADLIPQWLTQGFEFGVAAERCPFLDIGTEQSYAEAEAFVSSHRDFFADA